MVWIENSVPFWEHQNTALCNTCAISADVAAVWTQFCVETFSLHPAIAEYLVLFLLLIF